MVPRCFGDRAGVLASGGTWNTTASNWRDSVGVTNQAWSNATGSVDLAVFGDGTTGNVPGSVTVQGPITVNAIRFDAPTGFGGPALFSSTSSDVMTFAGANPSIKVRAFPFDDLAFVTMNVAMAGSNGLTVAFDNANGGTRGTVVFGDGGTNMPNTLTGGITVAGNTTLGVQIVSTIPPSTALPAGFTSHNPLGTNQVTLQTGAELNVIGSSTTLPGLSGRVFDIVSPTTGLPLALANTSRVDYTQTATGANFYLATKNVNGVLGNVVTVASTADLRTLNAVSGTGIQPTTTITGVSSGASIGSIATVGTNVLRVTSTADFVVGQPVSGVGIPAGSVVLAIVDSTHFTLGNQLGGPVNVTVADPNIVLPPVIRLSLPVLQLNPTITVRPTSVATGLPTSRTHVVANSLAGGAASAINFQNKAGATATKASYAVQWNGTFLIGTAGAYSFFSSSDDGSRIYIDGVLVLNNDGGKGATDLSSAPINLATGRHSIRIDYIQSASGAGETLAYSGPDTGDFSGLTPGDKRYARVVMTASGTADLQQAEVNTNGGASTHLQLNNAITVTGDSTISMSPGTGGDFTGVQLGALTINTGRTLSVRALDLIGNPVLANDLGFGKTASFGGASTTVFGDAVGGNGTVTITAGSANTNYVFDPEGNDPFENPYSTANVNFSSAVSDGGRNMNIRLNGAGRFSFSQTGAANLLGQGTSIEVGGITADLDNTAGISLRTVPSSLVLVGSTAAGAFNPIGSALIRLNGGNLVLDSKGATTAGIGPTFNNAVSVQGDGVIQSVVNAAITTLGGDSFLLSSTTSTSGLGTTVTVASTAGLRIGQLVKGVGIAPGTVISSIDSATTFKLSAAATVSATNTLSYGNGIKIESGKTLTLDAIAGGRPAGDPGATLVILGDIVGDNTTTLAFRSTLMNSASLGTVPLPQVGFATATKGTVILKGDNSGFLGNVSVEIGANVRIEDVFALSNKDISVSQNVLTFALDGDGTGGAETFAFNNRFTVNSSSTVAVGRAGTTYAPYFITASNKTMQMDSLTMGTAAGTVFTLSNANGYGVTFLGTTQLSQNAAGFSVTTATASNLVPGLALNGKVTGAFGFSKTGAGTLVLNNLLDQNVVSNRNDFGGVANLANTSGAIGTNTLTTNSTVSLVVGTPITQVGTTVPAGTFVTSIINGNTFTINNLLGAALSGATLQITRAIDIAAGVVAAAKDTDLGDSRNVIILSGANATFRAIGTFSTAHVFTFTSASSIFEVTSGNTLTITSGLNLPVIAGLTQNLTKSNAGALVLTQPLTGWKGVFTVTQGSLVIKNANALSYDPVGATAADPRNTVISEGRGSEVVFDLAGSGTSDIKEPFQITMANNTTRTGLNSRGILRNQSGTNTLTGVLNLSGDATSNDARNVMMVGVDTGSSLTIAGSIRYEVTTRQTGAMNLYLSASGTGVGTLASSLANIAAASNSKEVTSLVKIGTGTWNITKADVFRLNLATTTTNNSTLVTVGDTTGFYAGMTLTGNPNIPVGATVQSIVDRTSFILTSPAIGNGTVTTLYASPASNITSIIIDAGTFGLLGAGSLSVSGTGTVSVNPGATLNLNNSLTTSAADNVTDRLGLRPLSLFGGRLNLIGNAAAASSEQTGTFTFGSGNSVVTVTPNAAQSSTLTMGISTTVARAAGATALFRGTNLGNAAAPNTAVIVGPAAANGLTYIGQLGGTGSTNKSILPWALVDTNVNGSGVSFATANSALSTTTTGVNPLRALSASEMSTALTSLANVALATNAAVPVPITVNSLTLQSGGGVTITSPHILTVESGGILALTGNAGINGGQLSTGGGENSSFTPLVI